MFIRTIAVPLVSLALVMPSVAATEDAFRDTLDTPARTSVFAAKSLLNGVVNTGKRIVAAGQRGHIVYSDDTGKTWTQAKVPVSSDLVAVAFPTPGKGWAVGHDGVVLHSADGGATWTRQLDGRSAGKLMVDFYTAQAAKGALGSAETAAALIEEAKRVAAQGAENAFLDVWFADENNGFIVGAFNLIFRTADGGKSWEPWFHRTENPKRLHLYSLRNVAGTIYLVGEQGLVLKLDAAGTRFTAVETGYKGSFFGVTGNADGVLVHGLRGNVYRTTDAGRPWRKIETGIQEGLTGASFCSDRGLILVSQSGRMLLSDNSGESFRPLQIGQAAPASAVACLDGKNAVIVGARGVRVQAFQ
ncbi:MAG: glycosyl hydrolase [Betaproteobacteria bacterium]|nr:glycosyl hydrolase [Betaproteobacteria bacterium]